MNPFLESPVARPQAVPTDIGCHTHGRQAWRRLASGMVLAGGIGCSLGGPVLAESSTRINVNIATVAELIAVRGIGPKTAALIVSERERAGPYVSFQDFAERIRGIGPKRAATLQAAGVGVSSSPPRTPLPVDQTP